VVLFLLRWGAAYMTLRRASWLDPAQTAASLAQMSLLPYSFRRAFTRQLRIGESQS
jgi:hypothetical protein